MEGWNLKAVEVLQAQSPPNLPFTSILTPPPPPTPKFNCPHQGGMASL